MGECLADVLWCTVSAGSVSARLSLAFPLVAQGEPAAAGADSIGLLVVGLTVFALAMFVGFEVITKVPPTLHTPLMSGSNAISGITVVGAIVCAGRGDSTLGTVLALLAVVLATINVVGGFLVTNRMLLRFKKKK
jgi:NAD(P) transhydrogenase subunit alpha